MGQVCCGGSRYNKVYDFEPKLSEWRSDFEALQFKEQDIGRLYRIYNKIDGDKSGLIDYMEMLSFLDIERTPFSKRVFTMFDEDGSGKLDFKEFVMSLWNYCTLGKDTLILFAFDIYDKDSSGEIEGKEVHQMLNEIYGKNYKNNTQALQIAKEIDVKLGDVDIEELKSFSRTHPALLFPAFNMQFTLQKGTLGESFWKYYSTRRIELSKGQYIPISEFMEIHTDKELKKRVTTNVQGKKMNKKTLEIIEKTGSAAERRMSKVAVTDHHRNHHNNNKNHKDKDHGHDTEIKKNSSTSSIAAVSGPVQVELLRHPHPEEFFEDKMATGRRLSIDKGKEKPSSRRNSFDEKVVHSGRRSSFDKGIEAPQSGRRSSFDKEQGHDKGRRGSLTK